MLGNSNDFRFQRKPGTPLDRSPGRYMAPARPATGNRQAVRLRRQAERNVERQCERGYVCLNGEWLHIRGRNRGLRPVFPGELEPLVAVKGVVSGHVLDSGAMGLGPDY